MPRLIVKNLPKRCSSEALLGHMKKYMGPIARTAPETANEGGVILDGLELPWWLTDLVVKPKRRFAFVGVESETVAEQVQQSLSGSRLGDGQLLVEVVANEVPPSKRARKTEAGAHDDDGPTSDPSVLSDTRVFVRNLPFSVTEDDVRALLKPSGRLLTVHVPTGKGFAFGEFADPASAADALVSLQGKVYKGRRIHVLPAEPARDESSVTAALLATPDGASSTFKDAKLEERRAAAETTAFNAFFIRSDVVADALAYRLGVPKSELLGAPDAAVRLALGEAQLAADTRDALASVGIDVRSLLAAAAGSRNVRRSNDTLLVKGVPFLTADRRDDLRVLLTPPSAPLRHFFVPPTGTCALVQFQSRNDAKGAMRRCAYAPFRGAPLLLEWAPEGAFDLANEKGIDTLRQDREAARPADDQTDQGVAETQAEQHEEEEAARTLYVKNLNFETDEDSLRATMCSLVPAKLGTTERVTIASTTSSATSDVVRSLGYGFVRFTTKAAALAAYDAGRGHVLDGHALRLEFVRRRSGPKAATRRGAAGADENADQVVAALEAAAVDSNAEADTTAAADEAADAQSTLDPSTATRTTLAIKNIPFEATRSELLALFRPFPGFQTIRLPQKYGGGHRGFGFAEFASRAEAGGALAGVGGAHLYGRRLVLEIAKKGGASKEEVGQQ